MQTVPIETIKAELRRQGFVIQDDTAGFFNGVEAFRAEKVNIATGIVTSRVKIVSEKMATPNSQPVVDLAKIYEATNSEGVLLSESFRRDYPRHESAEGERGKPGRITIGEHRGEHRGKPGEHGKK